MTTNTTRKKNKDKPRKRLRSSFPEITEDIFLHFLTGNGLISNSGSPETSNLNISDKQSQKYKSYGDSYMDADFQMVSG